MATSATTGGQKVTTVCVGGREGRGSLEVVAWDTVEGGNQECRVDLER